MVSEEIKKAMVPVKRGLGGLARTAKRFRDAVSSVPSPTAYNVRRFPTKVAPNRKPFNSTRSRDTVVCTNDTPGPGTYSLDTRRDRRLQLEHSFGGRAVLCPVVETRCLQGRTARCTQCGLEPRGDYWEHRGGTALCRPCMAVKQHALNSYKKVRSCWMIHRHEGTVAATVLMEARILRRLQQKEAYFHHYFT